MQWIIAVDVWAVVAALLGIGLLVVVCLVLNRQRREVLPTETPSPAQRESAARKLWTLYPALPDEDPDTALFLLDESKRTYDGWVESNGRIEGKATRLLGLLAGGAGLLTVFGSTQGEKARLMPGPFLYLAIASAFGALIFCLYVVRPKLRPHPSVSDYVSPALAISPKSRFHIALSLAEDYGKSVLELALLRRYDPVAWTAAQACLALAALAILMHFLLYVNSVPARHMVICRGQTGAFHAGLAWKASCEETPNAR
jgi:hypothetical protein